jgi:hypothetical protein
VRLAHDAVSGDKGGAVNIFVSLHDIAAVDADAHVDASVRIGSADFLLQALYVDAAGECVPRRGEGRQDPVSEGFDDPAVVPVDCAYDTSDVLVKDALRGRFTEADMECGRVLDVCDRDGDQRVFHAQFSPSSRPEYGTAAVSPQQRERGVVPSI